MSHQVDPPGPERQEGTKASLDVIFNSCLWWESSFGQTGAQGVPWEGMSLFRAVCMEGQKPSSQIQVE